MSFTTARSRINDSRFRQAIPTIPLQTPTALAQFTAPSVHPAVAAPNCDQFQNQIEDLKYRLRNATDEIRLLTGQFERVQPSFDILTERVDILQTDNDKMRDIINKGTADNLKLRQEISNLQKLIPERVLLNYSLRR